MVNIKQQQIIANKKGQRSLTAGEIMLAKKVFKYSINYNNTKIVRGKLLGMPNTSNNAMTPFGNIHFPEIIYDTISNFSKGSVDDQVLVHSRNGTCMATHNGCKCYSLRH